MSGDEKYNPLKDEIFLPVPLKIARNKNLRERSKLIYGYIARFSKMNRVVRLKAQTIADDLNIPRRKVSDYTKELENEKLIKTKRTNGANEYELLPIPDATHAGAMDATHAGAMDATHAGAPLYNRESFRESFRESGKKAAPDFLKKQKSWQSIPIEIRRRLNKNQVVKASIEKIEYAIERMNAAIEKGGSPARAFQDAFKGDHAKFTQKMEGKAVAEKKQHDMDIVKMAEKINSKKKTIPYDKRVALALNFIKAMSPAYDNHHIDAIFCDPYFKSYERNNLTQLQ